MGSGAEGRAIAARQGKLVVIPLAAARLTQASVAQI